MNANPEALGYAVEYYCLLYFVHFLKFFFGKMENGHVMLSYASVIRLPRHQWCDEYENNVVVTVQFMFIGELQFSKHSLRRQLRSFGFLYTPSGQAIQLRGIPGPPGPPVCCDLAPLFWYFALHIRCSFLTYLCNVLTSWACGGFFGIGNSWLTTGVSWLHFDPVSSTHASSTPAKLPHFPCFLHTAVC